MPQAQVWMLQTLNKKQMHKVVVTTTYKLGSDYYKVANLQQKTSTKAYYRHAQVQLL
jgi:hypothetical protein